MDILTHTLSGVAVGTVVSSFSNSNFKTKLKIVLLSGFAGALPDLDAISLWSKFDSTIGSFFNLSVSGKEIYSAKYWYSHHAFMHSLTAGLLFTIILAIIHYFIGSTKGFINSVKRNKLIFNGFFFGFLLHLLEDMPTPSSAWGGVNFFFPSKSYIGGTGDIWWWNNYDIFLIVVSVIILNLMFSVIRKFVTFNLRKITVCIFIMGFSLSVIQIKSRNFDFAYTGYTKRYAEFENKSKQIQKEILGEKLYKIMENFDNKLKIYF